MSARPNKSGLLVASPQMVDLFFSKTVVLLCDYNEDGALGIVVNRTTGIDSDKVLEQMGVKDGGALVGPVLWGGPVQPGAVFLTFAETRSVGGDVAPESPDFQPVFRVSQGVRVSPSRDVIESVAREGAGRHAFLSLGYAGWAPGQLDGEIRSGSWIFMELDEDLLWKIPPEKRYEHCIESLGVDQKMIWMKPVDE
jgi:putative transcriptional regulator